MEDMESLLIPQISMDVDETPLNLEENQGNADEACATTDSDNEENVMMRLRNLLDLENFDPAQTPEKLSSTELEAKERLFSEGHPPIEYVRMHCSSCNCHLGTAPLNQDNRYIHPLLNVLVCKNCYEFYCSGDFEKDEDGSELYCRWCGQGGKVMCCSGCAYVFCQKCVRQNLGKRTLDLIIESDDWYCFVCNPSQLVNLRILCATLFDYVKQEIREVRQSGEIDRLKRDFSMCCTNKSAQQRYVMPVRRRRRVPSEDQTYHPSRDKDLIESRRSNNMLKKTIASNSVNAGGATVMGAGISKPLPPLQKGGQGVLIQSPPPLVGIGGNTVNIRFNQSSANQRTSNISAIRGFPPIHPRPNLLQNALNNNNARPQLSAKPVQVLCATNTRPITSNTVSNMAASLNNQLSSTNMNRGSQNFIPLNSNQMANATGIVRLNNTQVAQASRRVSSLPTHFPPGIRNNWFNQAATITSTIVARLSTSLVDLSNEQANATSVEQLATVHNKLQELLSSSVNSMIQVRKNLRNEFLNDLNKMKFTAVPKQQNSAASSGRKASVVPRKMLNSQPIAVDDDDDVIIVNNEEEDPLAITTTEPPIVDSVEASVATAAPSVGPAVDFITLDDKTPTKEEPIKSCQILAGPGIKIKVKTDLFKAGTEQPTKTNGNSIEIEDQEEEEIDCKPDISYLIDDSVEDTETEIEKNAEPVTAAPVTAEPVTAEVEIPKEPATIPTKTDDLSDVDKETYMQIQHALAESKLEALIEENSKYKVDTAEICPEELAKILTVRVVLTTNFSSFNSTPKRRRLSIKQEAVSPGKNSIDFEEILHGNLINTEQAKPHFDEAFSSFVEQNKSTEDIGEIEDEEEDEGARKENGEEKEVNEIVVDPLENLAETHKESGQSDNEKTTKQDEEKVAESEESSILNSSDEKMQTEQIDVR